MTVRLRQVVLLSLFTLLAAPAMAQEPASAERASADEHAPGQGVTEDPDPTRLDVARLPPEAATITRDLYAHGFFVEAQLGALGFVGDLGDVATPGPRLAVTFGYELANWVSLVAGLEGSLHITKNRAPPAHTAFEMAGANGGLRLAIPFNARAALWASGLIGVVWTGGDVLKTLGFKDAIGLGVNYGGELGFDWHMKSRHHSIGLLGGARLYPSLARADLTIGSYGSVYLRYVF